MLAWASERKKKTPEITTRHVVKVNGCYIHVLELKLPFGSKAISLHNTFVGVVCVYDESQNHEFSCATCVLVYCVLNECSTK